MQSSDNIDMICPICRNQYNQYKKKPLIVDCCGTICDQCFDLNSSPDKTTYKCPIHHGNQYQGPKQFNQQITDAMFNQPCCNVVCDKHQLMKAIIYSQNQKTFSCSQCIAKDEKNYSQISPIQMRMILTLLCQQLNIKDTQREYQTQLTKIKALLNSNEKITGSQLYIIVKDVGTFLKRNQVNLDFLEKFGITIADVNNSFISANSEENHLECQHIIGQLQAEMDMQEKMIIQLQEEKKQGDSQIKNNLINRYEQEIADLKSSNARQVEDLQTKIQSQIQMMTHMQAQIQNNQLMQSQLQQNQGTLQEQSQQQIQQLTQRLQQEQNNYSYQSNEMQKHIQSLQQDIQQLRSQNQELYSKNSQLESLLKDFQDERDRTTRYAEDVERSLFELNQLEFISHDNFEQIKLIFETLNAQSFQDNALQKIQHAIHEKDMRIFAKVQELFQLNGVYEGRIDKLYGKKSQHKERSLQLEKTVQECTETAQRQINDLHEALTHEKEKNLGLEETMTELYKQMDYLNQQIDNLKKNKNDFDI